MDNVTHTLTAVAISQAGLNRKTRFATLALVIAGNIPDVDVAAGFVLSARYLEAPRGVSPSILGAALFAGVGGGRVFSWGPRRPPPPEATTAALYPRVLAV